MYEVVIIGAGISGLYSAKLLLEKGITDICIIDKSNKIGGLIDTRFKNIKGRQSVKYEAGPAVLYSYQKNMLRLIEEYDISMFKIKLKHNSIIYHCENGYHQKMITKRPYYLFKKVFSFIKSNDKQEMRKYSFYQVCQLVLGNEKTNFLQLCYGFNLDFKEGNAVSTMKNIENEILNSKEMYFFKNGYQDVVDNLYDTIKSQIDVFLDQEIESFTSDENNVRIFIKNHPSIMTKKLICTIPKESLLKLKNTFSFKEQQLLDSVKGGSLCRLFVQFDMTKKKNLWLKDIEVSRVDNPLGFIIPIKKNVGLFQISYTDWFLADYWGKLNNNQWKELVKIFLGEIFCNQDIDDPIWCKKIYYKNAVHVWKPNYDEEILYNKILHMRKNVFIGGESYSKHQGWSEGAIKTSIDIVDKIN